MTDTSRTPGTGPLGIEGGRPELIVTRVAETWQFFAFVFAALITLALTLLDEIPIRPLPWRIVAKLAVFFGLAYLVLWNVRVRGWLAAFLVRFKQERR